MHVIGITDKGTLGDSELTPATLGAVRNPRVSAFVATDLEDLRILQARFNSELTSFLLVNDEGLSELRERDLDVTPLGQIDATDLFQRHQSRSIRGWLAILAGILAVLGYFYLEANGWIPHASETTTTAPQSKQHPHSSAQSGPLPKQEEHIDLDRIELSDLEMRPSGTRAITGDVRPFYLVSERIDNETGKTLASVTIRVLVQSIGSPVEANPHYNKDWQLFDQADLQVDGPIPPSIRGFSQQVQVLPPKGKAWTLGAEVLRATAE